MAARGMPVTAFASTLMPGGWPGIDAALVAMQVNVTRAMHDQRVRKAAEAILHAAGAPGGDRKAEAHAFYRFVKERIEYRRDPAWLEYIQDPCALLAHVEATERGELRKGHGPGKGWAAGDCDDHAQLVALLCLQVRLPVVNVLVAEDDRLFYLPKEDLLAEFARAQKCGRPVPIHVYCALRESKHAEASREWCEGDDRAPSGLISLDTARPGAAFDEHVAGMVRYVRPVVLESY